MRALVFVSLLIVFSAESSTKPRLNYYPTKFRKILKSDRLKNRDIIKALKLVISSGHIHQDNKPDLLVENCSEQQNKKCIIQKELSYTEARKYLFGLLHLKKDGQGNYLEDVYCRKTYTSGVGPGRIPNHQVVNCEHTWPQSRFSGSHRKRLQKGDLHHLYPTDSRANSTRGNHKFAEVLGDDATSDCSASQFGIHSRTKKSSYYEPPREHRGNVARALFYFATRYDLRISDEEEFFLRKWHKEDPVDAEEMKRNNMIEKIQGNRNPYIDLPKIVDQINNF